MNFPATPEILKQFNFFLITGPGAIIAGIIILIVSFIRFLNRKKILCNTNRLKWFQMLILSLVLMSIGWGHLNIYQSVGVAFDFQNIELDNVDMLVIEVLSAPRQKPSKIIKVKEAKNIRHALNKLNHSRSYSRNHETFFNGYRIRLIIKDGKKSRYISAYKNSTRAGVVNVVIPHYAGMEFKGMQFQGGVYQCDELLKWLDETMKERQKIN